MAMLEKHGKAGEGPETVRKRSACRLGNECTQTGQLVPPTLPPLPPFEIVDG